MQSHIDKKVVASCCCRNKAKKPEKTGPAGFMNLAESDPF
jgi:hypothetical protein